MPFRSQAQWRWAFATNQDFARQWAKETPGGKRKFVKLAKKVGFKSAIDSYIGTGASTEKARKYVRDNSGRFSETPGGGGSGGGKKPRKTAEQRQAERDQKRFDNGTAGIEKLGYEADAYQLLDEIKQMPADASAIDNVPLLKQMVDDGLLEVKDGKIIQSSLGRTVQNSVERGNVGDAVAAISRFNSRRDENAKRQADREAKRAEQEAKRAEREAKKKRGGGGGGGKAPKPAKPDKQTKPDKPAKPAKPKPDKVAKANAAKVKKLSSQIDRLSNRLEREKDGAKAQAYKKQIEQLTATRDKLQATKSYKATDGHVPPAGVRAAAQRGLDLRSEFGRGGTAVGIARARDLSNGKRISDSTIKRMNSFFARHAVDKRPGWSDPANPTNGYIAHMLWGGDAGKAWARKISRQLEASTVKSSVPTNPDLWRRAINAAKRRYTVYPSQYANAFASAWYKARGGKWRVNKSSDAMMVYKSKDGFYRWVAISATAYRDRDDEIISTKALRDAVANWTKPGDYGPLRFWHEPTINIGTTDFQALSDNGKFLIESGFIIDNDVGEALATKAKGWQMSIGFAHKRIEPDKDGVYHNIYIFERSITPPGMSANPLTGIEVSI